jgi:hypothetical protein
MVCTYIFGLVSKLCWKFQVRGLIQAKSNVLDSPANFVLILPFLGNGIMYSKSGRRFQVFMPWERPGGLPKAIPSPPCSGTKEEGPALPNPFSFFRKQAFHQLSSIAGFAFCLDLNRGRLGCLKSRRNLLLCWVKKVTIVIQKSCQNEICNAFLTKFHPNLLSLW